MSPDDDRSLDQEGIPDLTEGAVEEKYLTGDAQEEELPPPSDEPASLEYGTTVAEQRRGEPLADRLAREEPDGEVTAGDDPVFLVAPEDEDIELDTDDDADETGRAVGRGREGMSAEEAAVHVEELP
jgi:hypothetical protein